MLGREYNRFEPYNQTETNAEVALGERELQIYKRNAFTVPSVIKSIEKAQVKQKQIQDKNRTIATERLKKANTYTSKY